MGQKVYNFAATDATRESILLRLGICGTGGSGKTKTALIVATRMVERLGLGPVFVIDSENKSALRYAYSPRSKQGYRFKHVPMPEDDYGPAAYMAAMDYCESHGAGVVVIDSLSHAWAGINGILEQVDQVTDQVRRSRSGGNASSFSDGWKIMTPVYNRLVQRLLSSSAHVIFTLRSKADWVVGDNAQGRKEPQKVGLAPIFREGIDYDGDVFCDMTAPDNVLIVSKSRCDRLAPGEIIKRPGPEFADVLIEWIEDSDVPAGARTLGEAINLAVAEGIVAAEERSAERYKEAKRRLLAWCEASGVSPLRRDVAVAQFKERVAAVVGPKTTGGGGGTTTGTSSAAATDDGPASPRPGAPGAPTEEDRQRLRAIDGGNG